MKVLDCTLRDGGYYNNWDFKCEVVAAYLDAMANSGIEYVELGLRNFPSNEFQGAFAYTTEEHLNSLELPEGPTYGVMVDAKTILNSGLGIGDAIDKLFVPAKDSKIGLVRIAAHFHEVEDSGEIVKSLKDLGYIVGFNLMQAGGKDSELISQKAKIAQSWEGSLDALYFADSLGNMDHEEVVRIINAIRREWSGTMGIHTHDNMSKGLSNSLSALENGVEWLDSTITGMGRGAGNTQTEYLLSSLNDQVKTKKYDPEPIYSVVIKYFEKMQRECGWGSNLSYFLAAKNGIHPTYIQTMLSNNHYQSEEIVAAIQYLIDLHGTEKYSFDVLDKALSINSSDTKPSGSSELVNKFLDKEVLIIGGGPGASKYSQAIELYIKTKKPVVISVNVVEAIDENLVDYFCVSHNTKYLTQSEKYKRLESPLIAPVHRFKAEELNGLNKVVDYGIELGEEFTVNSTYCSLPKEMTIGYALAVAIVGKAKNINLVGVDGYASNDPRQKDMIDLLADITHKSEVTIKALTPTNYPINKGSIYALV